MNKPSILSLYVSLAVAPFVTYAEGFQQKQDYNTLSVNARDERGKKNPLTSISDPSDDKKVKAENEPLTSAEKLNSFKKGVTLYNKQYYSEAIPYFKKVLQSDSANKSLLSKLGDCYRLTNNSEGELLCYGALISMGTADPLQELYYGQALLKKGDTEKARSYFEKYGADLADMNLQTSFGKYNSYKRNSDAYALTFATFNSAANDICAIKFHDATIFASSRSASGSEVEKTPSKMSSYNVYTSEKNKKGEEKAPVKFMKALNTKFNDGPVCFSKDFYTIYYTTNCARKKERAKDGTYKLRIFEGELEVGDLEVVKLPGFINKEYNYAYPSLSSNGYTLYFASDMPGGIGGMDIYMSKKDSGDYWGTPVNLTEINTSGNDVYPFISQKGILYYSSDGRKGMGGLDIYEVQYKKGKKAAIYNLGEPVNSQFDDFGIFLEEDNRTGFITSKRKTGRDDDIYHLQILKDVKKGKDLLIYAKDKHTGLPLPYIKMLVNQDTMITNEKGELITLVEDDGSRLKIKTLSGDYFEHVDSVSAASSTNNAFSKELVLEKNPKLFLRALITDAKTNELLEGATISITDLRAGTKVDLYTTTAGGDYFKFLFDNRIGDTLHYRVKLEKPGYLPRNINFLHIISKPGEVNMNEVTNLSLGRIEVGMDLAQMVELQPIYFEPKKSDILPETAEELDKIIMVMNEFPNISIQVGSHTDCRSSALANMKLSSERAKAAANYIAKKGINQTRLSSRGFGETNLLNNCACEGAQQTNCPEEEHNKNNRLEFLITETK